MFLKAEILNVDMSLSAPEKPVAAESEDEKNGHRRYFYINNLKSNFLLIKLLVLPGNTDEGPSVDLLSASPKANPGWCHWFYKFSPLSSRAHLTYLGSLQNFRLCLRRNRLLARKRYEPLRSCVSSGKAPV